MSLKKELASRLFLGFLFAGGTAAMVNFLGGVLFRRFFEYTPAVILAFFCGLATAYVLNRFLVFGKSQHRTRVEMMSFFLVNLGVLAITWTVSSGLYVLLPVLGWTFHTAEVSHLAGICAPAVFSFLAHKRLTFKGAEKTLR